MATVAARAGTGVVLPKTRTLCGRPASRLIPDTADALPRPVSVGGGGGYRNRSPGWRPLVGCNQRRWTRPSRAVRRPRNWPRT